MKNVLLSTAALMAVVLVGCQRGAEEEATTAPSSAPSAAATPQQDAKLNPLPGKEGAVPALTEVATVRLATTAGDVVIEVYPQAAPNAAKRFLELVTSGFSTTRRSRAWFKASSRSSASIGATPTRRGTTGRSTTIRVYFSLERGTLSFAKAGRPEHGVDTGVHQLPREQSPRGPVGGS